MNSIIDAQQDMREAYADGATGALASATAWLVAAVVTAFSGPEAGVVTLFFGGMLIFPASVLSSKAMGRSGQHSKDNPLGPLAIQGTIWMVLSIFIAVGISITRVEWFFPAMLLIIGGRYLTFVTLYGLRVYWVFGAALVAAGALLVILEAPAIAGAYAGALTEYAFGIAILVAAGKSRPRSAPDRR